MPHISRRTSALAGLVLAPLWIAVVVVATLFELDFLRSLGWTPLGQHEVPYPSAIARSDLGFLLLLDYVLAAVLVVIFAAGFRREFRRTVPGGVATAGFGLFVVAMLLSMFPTDLPGEPTTWQGNLHVIGFLVVVVSALLGYGGSGLALRGNPAWRGWRLLGWTPVLLVVLFVIAGLLPGDLGFYLFVATIFGWYSVMGARLLAVDRAEGDRPVPAQVPDAAAPGLL
jgi:hypothetical protein